MDLSTIVERVMLVDDDEDMLGLLNRHMTLFGLQADQAKNGKEAVELLQSRQYGLVITDIVMPEMDGMELLLHIRKHYPQTDVLAISGYNELYDFTDLVAAGATDFISKPFKKDELAAKLQRIFRERFLLAELADSMENALQEKNEQLLSLINASPDIICFKDGEGRWLLANNADLMLFELEDVDYTEKKDSELACFSDFYHDAFLTCEKTDEKAWRKGTISRADELIPTPHDGTKVYDVFKIPLFHADGSRKGLVVLGRDVTDRVRAEKELRSEIAAHQDSLKKIEEKNIALKVLLDQHKAAGKEVEEQVTINLKKLVFPYIDLLQQTVSGKNEKEYLEIIEAHLTSLANSFTQKLSSSNFGLTQREILVADLVRQGKSTKDIAQLLGLAARSIEAYRYSLRKKLDIKQKKLNLRQYLLSTFSHET